MTAGPAGVVDAGEQLGSAITRDFAVEVLRGHPEDDELVALIAALTVLRRRTAATSGQADDAATSRWRYGVGLRGPLVQGPDAWRAAVR